MLTPGGLYWEEHGSGDARPLLLSAGLGGPGGYWLPNVPALAEGRRVILYDHRGTGRSDPALPDMVSIDDMARDMLGLLDDLGIERADVMGHALGGIAGLALAHLAPDRVGKLIVVNGWAKTHPYTLRCFAAREAILKAAGPRGYLEAQPIFLFPTTWIAENEERLARETEAHVAHFQGEANLLKRIAAIRCFDATPWIADLKAETLALAAKDDMLAPWTASAELAAANPTITLAEMEWGGHACNITDPDAFTRITLDFLRS